MFSWLCHVEVEEQKHVFLISLFTNSVPEDKDFFDYPKHHN